MSRVAWLVYAKNGYILIQSGDAMPSTWRDNVRCNKCLFLSNEFLFHHLILSPLASTTKKTISISSLLYSVSAFRPKFITSLLIMKPQYRTCLSLLTLAIPDLSLHSTSYIQCWEGGLTNLIYFHIFYKTHVNTYWHISEQFMKATFGRRRSSMRITYLPLGTLPTSLHTSFIHLPTLLKHTHTHKFRIMWVRKMVMMTMTDTR